ncbi:dimethyladenosine transferase [Methanosalsum zhilinae DSM 4017]|uniref:Probable ribosomal RNA small subunit methyltransferase A n=1 Tax=Methanosalsum zhilinae (strain DSM 4017 / NBRC 107636 / OCM 62 / WeN5) TaxID=679901 RepID=F7XN14_METZD|nr:16S rRNA (adenine(1518)-N(6)/adenine(1519)-N(6))-dimethyltransferase RsmA [Methanosalsum zhilinae]AEH61123.1 dimethyladenosine transferase [Methanosalsum zhilinae DSM 4017]
MVRSLLKKYGIQGGSHDQHFLVDNRILERIIEESRIGPEDVVLEIGAGVGNLTEKIASKAKKTIAIELDPNLVDVLHDRFGDHEEIQIISGDVLEVEFPPFNKVVANLPYSISSPVTFKLLRYDFDLGVLMYQYEFARRMVACTGSEDYSRLSVATQYYADAEIIMKIPASAFSPPPKVMSAVVKLVPRPFPYKVVDESFFFKFITAVFGQRRKKLKNSIMNNSSKLGLNKEDVKEMIIQLPQDIIDKRPENLSPFELADIANGLKDIKQL